MVFEKHNSVRKNQKKEKIINVSYNSPRFVVSTITALLFLAFAAYQGYLFFASTVQRGSGLVGMITFVGFAVASILAVFSVPALRIVRSTLLVFGLMFYFLTKLLSGASVFGKLDFFNIPSVLNAAVFVCVELGLLVLLIYYAVLRHNIIFNIKRTKTLLWMSVVIVLFISSLIMECILMFQYGVSTELSRNLTLCSCFLYCFSFVGMAIGFMLPTVNKTPQIGQFFQRRPYTDDILVVSPNRDKPRQIEENRPLFQDTDILVSSPKMKKPSLFERNKRPPKIHDTDILVSSPKMKKPGLFERNKQSPMVNNNDIIVSSPQMDKRRPNKEQLHPRVINETDIVFSPDNNSQEK